jgi:uncharacterized protein YndB with AHSA1/START domain
VNDLHIDMPPDEPVIALRRLVKAPPTLVFRLYTEPDHLRRWWGPRHLELVTCDIDLRVGGTYRFLQRAPDGQEFRFHGTYLEIEPPHRLVKTFVFEGRPDNEAIDTYTFQPAGADTIVHCRTVHSSIAARDAHARSGARAGLAEAYQRLNEHLETLRRSTLQ